jgi:hypothetical protein
VGVVEGKLLGRKVDNAIAALEAENPNDPEVKKLKAVCLCPPVSAPIGCCDSWPPTKTGDF